jgi:solute carrier family 25 aspartate/glutamate transporter 12/13
MATVSEQVGEVLLGTTDEPQLSQLTRAAFLKHAQKDEETGAYYLDEEHFIDAVAPESEDYVSNSSPTCLATCLATSLATCR